MARFMGWMAGRKLFSDALLLQLYPPFLWMRIKVLELDPRWQRVRIRLPLNAVSRNPGGIMFGGFQAALADPIAALACARRFPGYSVWTRAINIDFERAGHTHLELRFEFPESLDTRIREQLAAEGRATPTFEYGFHLADGTRCTVIRNTVAIRPRGYRLSQAGQSPARPPGATEALKPPSGTEAS